MLVCADDFGSFHLSPPPFPPSVLYVTGLVTGFAGWLSPVCLLMVAGILYLYRQAALRHPPPRVHFRYFVWLAPVSCIHTAVFSAFYLVVHKILI